MARSTLADRWSRAGRACLAASAALGTLAVSSSGFAPIGAQASSHREAPLISSDPKVDNTDVYAFTSPDDPTSVTIVANWLPFEEPVGGPNFYGFDDNARYDINIDNDGDAVADITYRYQFNTTDSRGGTTFLANNGPVNHLTDPTLLVKQTYNLTRIAGGTTTLATGAPVAPSYAGKASMPNYATLRQEAITSAGAGRQSFAGQADDPFFADLRVFDLLYGGDLKSVGQDTLAGYNVQTVALKIPKSELALGGNATRNPVIGIWSATSKQTLTLAAGTATPGGAFVQVSRLGNPLVNEAVAPAGLKDAFNGSVPAADHLNAALVNRVNDPEIPHLIQAIYGLAPPAAPRRDLVEIFLTGIATNAPTLDAQPAPIQADLNAHVLNQDVVPASFVPSEELRLNMSVPVTASPNRLGVLAGDLQGFPNGRRLTDDVVDIELQALEGAAQTGHLVPALAAGDGVNANNTAFGASFPYVALPNTTAVNRAVDAGGRGGGMPVGGVNTGAGGALVAGWGWLPITAGVGALVLLAGGLLVRVRRRSALR
ncbi:DUF4331 domain-containing protein [Dactylosporangium vinaceum]|uniref:DUF4331 domain-containing protein n=1 Tax=Dactylosporangium vinaceum TaxID=53362 RepID=A0ABV5M5W9_9ACTN|nr:DUF4331 domain-containing protein [Dactylosporangium vinaceum]UAB95545.1 DUF4331 domain-containing protein [Dactylosporangium vinaceum]